MKIKSDYYMQAIEEIATFRQMNGYYPGSLEITAKQYGAWSFGLGYQFNTIMDIPIILEATTE